MPLFPPRGKGGGGPKRSSPQMGHPKDQKKGKRKKPKKKKKAGPSTKKQAYGNERVPGTNDRPEKKKVEGSKRGDLSRWKRGRRDINGAKEELMLMEKTKILDKKKRR